MTSIPPPKTWPDALEALREGNARFAQGTPRATALVTGAQRAVLAGGQSPFAIVLSCSDSRVPAELVFDCGLGDLFVVRVAGNVCAPSLVGSVEFAVAAFGTQLVVVMGHTKCGAVVATLDSLMKRGEPISDNVRDIVERIAPSVAELVDLDLPRQKLIASATRANVRASAGQLRHASRVLERRVADGKLSIVGAEYDLDTGRVDIFDR
jgi:carbonic anhydrase